MIKTSDELIDAFGGTGETADMLNVAPSTVACWRARQKGRIPAEYYLRLTTEAKRRRLGPISPGIFNMVPA